MDLFKWLEMDLQETMLIYKHGFDEVGIQ